MKSLYVAQCALLACVVLLSSAAAEKNETLWKQQLQEMIELLPVNLQSRVPVVHEIPASLPFGSFTIGNHIFLSQELHKFPVDEQRAMLGHELWHAVQGDTASQLKSLALYIVASIAGYYVVSGTDWWQSCSWKLRALLLSLGGYGVYALFHKWCVRPMELVADAASAHVLDNKKALVRMHTERLESDQSAPLIFRLIAPFHPTEQEFLEAAS